MTRLDPASIESRNQRLQLENASRSTRVTVTQPQRTIEPSHDDTSMSNGDAMIVLPRRDVSTELVPPPPKVKR
jgi:hypothetical protein